MKVLVLILFSLWQIAQNTAKPKQAVADTFYLLKVVFDIYNYNNYLTFISFLYPHVLFIITFKDFCSNSLVHVELKYLHSTLSESYSSFLESDSSFIHESFNRWLNLVYLQTYHYLYFYSIQPIFWCCWRFQSSSWTITML